MLKILWDFEIQTDHLIPARRPDEKRKKERKKNAKKFDFSDHWVKLKESEKRDKYRDFCLRTKNAMEHENDGDTNRNFCAW